MKRFFISLMLTLLATAAAAVAVSAQTSGRLSGTVSGPDGALPNAQIVVRDNQTGRELTVQTYTVTITAQGFKTFTATDLKIDIGREYTLNPTLEVGGVAESVTVSAGADIINGANAELSNTVSPRQVVDLPLNGRNPLALVSLQAGASATSNAINGQRSSNINVTRDGINVQDQFIRSGNFVADQPTVDDTGEFTVTTQNASADQGNGGSSQIQLVTPRGGQQFNGALFIFNRNSKFAANEFFNNSSGTEKPFLNRNQIGGKLSGPLPFPNFSVGDGPMFVKDKAFFFVAYERLFLRTQTSATNTVLLDAARNGTFTYTDNGGVVRTVNVLTGQGLNLGTAANQTAFNNAGGVLTVDPIVQSRLLAGIPGVGNLGAPSNGGLTQSYLFNVRSNRDRDSFVSRVDYDINNRNTLNFVYRLVKDALDRPDAEVTFETAPPVTQTDTTHLFTGAYRTFIGANFTNEFRIGYTQSKPFFNEGAINSNFIIAGLPFGITSPEASFESQGRNTRLVNFRDDANWTVGDHSIRFGGILERHRIVTTQQAGTTPVFTFSTTANTNTPRLASALFPGGINATQRTRADLLRYFLGGIIGAGAVQANPTGLGEVPTVGTSLDEELEFDVYGLYVGDQWRVSPSLTLNFGVRYDVFTPLRNTNSVLLEPVVPNGADPVATIINRNGSYDYVGTSIGKPGQATYADRNNFGPQFSFAWSPQFKNNLLGSVFGSGRTVIRGGYRISYVNDEYVHAPLNALRGNDGLSITVNALDTVGGQQTTNINRRLRNLSGVADFPSVPFTPPPFTFIEGYFNSPYFNTIFAVDPKLQVPRIEEYNIGIQRELGFNTALEIRYVGSRSNSLFRAFDFNQVNIRDTGFAADFLRAQNNCRLQAASIGQSGLNCTDASYNPAIAGSQPLPVFAQLPFGAFLNNGTVIGQLQAGTPGQLAFIYASNGLDIDDNGNGVQFKRNPFAGPVDYLTNGGKLRYNSLQVELRRRFTQGFTMQANYTFAKALTDVPEEDQNRFDPFLDIENPQLEYSRADFDRTHAFNLNAIYELPFGRGKAFFDQGGLVDALLGGYQISTIIQAASGPPVSILDPRGTLNRTSRSGRQTALTTLNKQQIKDLIGIYRTPNGVYFINPSVIAPDGTATGGNVNATPQNPAFQGQAFFNVPPGQTGNLERAFLNGPAYFTVDVGLSKRIRFTERVGLQLRAEAFNVLNRANFLLGTGTPDGAPGESSGIFNINNTNFGRITNTYTPRILQFGARFEF
jgi:hypothetical protein